MRDNVLPKIMAASEGHSELFQREIAKYDTLKADIAGARLPTPLAVHIVVLLYG